MKLEFNRLAFFLLVLFGFGIVALVLGLVFGLQTTVKRTKAAIVSNGKGCAEIGGQMLDDGGSVVDAAIATLLCDGVMVPQSMGIGGGFVGVIYTKSTGKVETVIARETAPAAAYKNMFDGVKDVTGVNASAVPGELLGYWEMHQKYGILPWKQLFQPTIKLCKEGHWVSDFIERVLKLKEDIIRNEPSMSEIFIKKDGTLYKEGDYIKRPQLAKTLEIIAEKGVGEMYEGGEIAQNLVEDIKEMGGIITVDDLKNFKVQWEDSDHAMANVSEGYTLYTTPLPTSGPLLSFMMNVMHDMYTNKTEIYWQRLIETFKHAYGRRSSLGDMENDPDMRDTILTTLNQLKSQDFAKSIRSLIHDDKTSKDIKYYGGNFSFVEDHGTANIAVVAPNGDAIVITSTVNAYFGGRIRSRRTGIILNDEMGDFSTPGVANMFDIPPSPSNYIKPGKRPMSSMSPAIILDRNGDVRMLIGAAGGAKITSSVATVISKYLVLNQTLEDAIHAGRMHHQLVPMYIDVEADVPESYLDYLKSIGHELNMLAPGTGFTAITAIGIREDSPEPMYDPRRVGSTFSLQARNKMVH